MSRSLEYEAYLEIEQQNQELREQLAAYTDEVQILTEHLDQSRDENEYLSQKIYRIENDLAEERIENASREHFLLRQSTPGAVADNTGNVPGSARSRVSFYGLSDQGSGSNQSSPRTNRTGSVFENHDNDLEESFRSFRASSAAEMTSDHHVAGNIHHVLQMGGSVDSNRTLQRRSMSYHDVSDIRDRQEIFRIQKYHSYHAPEDDYEYDQEIGYFDDELVPSSYYVDEQTQQECQGCKEGELKVRDLEDQIAYLDDQVEDKDRFIESLEFEIDELQTQLRALKLDKDIVEYELGEKVVFSTEKLNNTENCLKQKDQAYMDLLERFVSLEKNYEDVNSRYKSKLGECSSLSEKLSGVEFDLIIAEEQLNKMHSKRIIFGSTESSSDGQSCRGGESPPSPTRKHKLYNIPIYERRSSFSTLEKCGLDQQPLSIRSSGSSVDLWDAEEEEFDRLESLKRARKEAEKHAQIQERLNSAKNVTAYDLFQITKELAEMSDEDVKENVPEHETNLEIR